MKLLKKKLLFALGSEIDFLIKEVKFEYKSYRYLYFRLSGFAKASVREAALELYNQGLIDKITREEKVYYRLTTLGKDKLLEGLGGFKSAVGRWDGLWRLVVATEVKEASRELKKALNRLGYKRLIRSVYLSPFNNNQAVKQLFLDKKWLGKVQVFEMKKLIVGDGQQLVRKLWHLEKRNDQYREFITNCHRVLKWRQNNFVALQQSKGGFKSVFDQYFSLLIREEGLPKQLLPTDWAAEEAKYKFLRVAEMAKTANL